MMERLVFGAIDLYQKNLRKHGLEPNTSEMGRIAYAQDGWPGLWEMYKGVELAQACKHDGLSMDEEPPITTFAGCVIADFLHGLTVMAGNVSQDAGWWGELEPVPVRIPRADTQVTPI